MINFYRNIYRLNYDIRERSSIKQKIPRKIKGSCGSRLEEILDVYAVLFRQCLEGDDLEYDVCVPHALAHKFEPEEHANRRYDCKNRNEDAKGCREVVKQ